MRLNGKGQVTIPAELRHRHGFVEGDEVDVIEDGDGLRIVHREAAGSPGERLVARMRGVGIRGGASTDELMELLRGE